MTNVDKWESLFRIERDVTGEHKVRPELIERSRERIMPLALEQIISCERRECNGGTGICDNSCQEASAFIAGKELEENIDEL